MEENHLKVVKMRNGQGSFARTEREQTSNYHCSTNFTVGR